MATYLLTTGDDKITGTDDADTFEGTDRRSGGNDMLDGAGGDDVFNFDGFNQAGKFDGGIGNDTLALHDVDLGKAQFKNIEILDVLDYDWNGVQTRGTIEQISSFSEIVDSNHPGHYIHIALTGSGGTIDFSTRMPNNSLYLSTNSVRSALDVIGSVNNDYIVGTIYDDVLDGNDGNDEFFGSKGVDTLRGGAGNDKFVVFGSPKGLIDGGEGIDTLSAFSTDISDVKLTGVENLIVDYGSLSATISQISSFGRISTSDTDIILILKGAGDQIDVSKSIRGNAAVIITDGGVTSGYSIVATSKNDTLSGSKFSDTIQGGMGADIIDGGDGIDTVSYTKSSSQVFIYLNDNHGSGGDAVGDVIDNMENVIGSRFDDLIYGSNISNRLFGGEGDDELFGGAAADYLSGGAGADTASYFGALAGVTVSLTNSASNTGDAVGDTFNSIENLTGSDFNDKLDGSAGANTILGHDGDDTLGGLAGNDKLFGDWGNDLLEGGAGNDKLYGGLEYDTLIGGAGADYLSGGYFIDTASYVTTNKAVAVNLADPSLNTGDARGDTFNSIENLEGSAFNDTLDGNAGANTLIGLGGIDVLRGAAGNDTLQGGDGDDKLGGGDGNDLLSGGSGADYLNGGLGTDTASYAGAAAGVIVSLAVPAGNTGEAAGDIFLSIENLEGSGFGDRLSGNSAANAISGLNGADVIDGGAGSDTLTGGAAKDFFVFSTALGASNIDTIADFSAADDTIRLDNAVFAALGANGALLSGFFRANATGTAQDANDFIVYETDTGKLFYDVDGNGAGTAIQFAMLTGNPAITAADFQVI